MRDRRSGRFVNRFGLGLHICFVRLVLLGIYVQVPNGATNSLDEALIQSVIVGCRLAGILLGLQGGFLVGDFELDLRKNRLEDFLPGIVGKRLGPVEHDADGQHDEAQPNGRRSQADLGAQALEQRCALFAALPPNLRSAKFPFSIALGHVAMQPISMQPITLRRSPDSNRRIHNTLSAAMLLF